MKGAFTGFIVLILMWFCVTEFDFVPPLYLPHPFEVLYSFQPRLLISCAASVSRALIGFLFGVSLAYTVHCITVITGTVKSLDPHFAASRAVPAIALMPLFLLWFGFGETGRVIMVTLTSTLFFIAPLHTAFQNVPREWTLVSNQLHCSALGHYIRIIFPATAAALEGSYRLTLAICFTIAIASDYMGAQYGIGKFIDSARVTYNIPGVFLAIIFAALCGLLLDRILIFIYRRLVHWPSYPVKG